MRYNLIEITGFFLNNKTYVQNYLKPELVTGAHPCSFVYFYIFVQIIMGGNINENKISENINA